MPEVKSPAPVDKFNKCSDTPEYIQHHLEQLADRALKDPEVKAALDGRKYYNITFDAIIKMANVSVSKGLRRRFESVLLGKIKDPEIRRSLTRKRNPLTKEDIYFWTARDVVGTEGRGKPIITSPGVTRAHAQLNQRRIVDRVLDMSKRGRAAELLGIVKARIGTIEIERGKRWGEVDIMKHIADNSDGNKLLECMAAIHQLGELKHGRAINWLIKVVEVEKDNRLRHAAIIALGKIGDKHATHVLLKVLDPNRDELALTQKIALSALGRIGDKRSLPNLMKIAVRPDLLGLAPSALAALSQMPEVIVDNQTAFRSMLVKLLQNEDFQLRNTAAMVLATLGDKRAVPNLIKMLAQSNFNNIDLNPMENISRLIKTDPSLINGKNATPLVLQHVYNSFLARYSRSKLPIFKMAVVERLMKLKDPRSILPLIILAKREPAMRKPVLAAIAHIVDKNSLPAVLALLKHADKVVRHFAVYFLGFINDYDVVLPLVKALRDPDPKVEREAIISLTRLSNLSEVRKEFFVDILEKKFKEKNTDYIVKLMIVKALKQIGSKKALGFLAGLQKDPDRQMRNLAADAFRAIKAIREPVVIAGD